MKICTVCEQGRIMKAKLKKNNNIIYICEECDSIWEKSDLTDYLEIGFGEYMKRLQLKGLWSELTEIEELN
ncbi:MAG: hypothetical protein AB9856_06375 [Cellulosilyticaceae bacterium]